MLKIGSGQTAAFPQPNKLYDDDCPLDWYVFGTMHLMEHNTSVSELAAKIVAWMGAIIGLLAGSAAAGVCVGVIVALATGAAVNTPVAWGVLAALVASLVGLLVAALIELLRQSKNDDNLGGHIFAIGPILPPPPASSSWPARHWWTSSQPLKAYFPKGKTETYDGAFTHDYHVTFTVTVTGGHA